MPKLGDTRTDMRGAEWKFCSFIVLGDHPDDKPMVRAGWFKTLRQPRRGKSTYYDYLLRSEEMKREAEIQQAKRGKFEVPADPFWEGLPTIAAYCCDHWWDDGKPRTVCKMSIVNYGSSVNVNLNDEERRRSITTTSGTVREALELLEAHLSAGNAPWRSWGPQKGK